MEKYSAMNRQLPPPAGLTPLAVYGALESLEGDAPDGAVVLQFPSVQAAKAWYHSADYQAALPHRKKGANYRAFIVEGID
jgi:uncharacterized protein (DUF1330 family)